MMRIVRSFAFPYDLEAQSWADLHDYFVGLIAAGFPVEEQLAIVDSIQESGVSEYLLGGTSMSKLLVTEAPPREPPIEILEVSTLKPGKITIRHRSHLGRDDEVRATCRRRVAVRLYWRFVRDKFGISAPQR